MFRFVFCIFIFIVCVSSFLYTLNFDYFLYVQATTYIQLCTSIFIAIGVLYCLLNKTKTNYYYYFTIDNIVKFILFLFILGRFATSPRYNILIDFIIMIYVWAVVYVSFIVIQKKCKLTSILYLFPILGTLQIVYSLLQYLSILPALFGFRTGGSFGNPGDLGNFIALTYSVSLGLLFIEKSKRRRICFGIVLAFHVFMIIISFARTAWLATIAATFFILTSNIKWQPFWFKIKPIVSRKKWLLPIMLLCFFALIGIVAWKMYGLKPASANGRLFIWQLCIQLIAEKPFFGHGYESFITVLRNAQIEYFSLHPHDIKNGMLAANSVFAFNDFLQFAVEYGMSGALLLLSLFILPFRKIKSSGGTERGILTTIRSAFIALFSCALFSYPLKNQTILVLFVILMALSNSYSLKAILQFSLSSKLKISLLFILFVSSLLLVNYSCKRFVYGIKWKDTYDLSQKDPLKAYNIYLNINQILKHDRSFLSSYGIIYYQLHEHKKLVNYYDDYIHFNPKSEIFLMIGESYEKLENHSKAEEKYRMASNLIPHLFVPRYRLFKLYQKIGEDEKALAEAKAISELEIKVYSETVKKIKTEVNEYLYNIKASPLPYGHKESFPEGELKGSFNEVSFRHKEESLSINKQIPPNVGMTMR